MAKTRIEEHVDNLEKRKEDSPLWEHAQIHHQGVIPTFEYKITGSYLKNPLQRQLMEAVNIDRSVAVSYTHLTLPTKRIV